LLRLRGWPVRQLVRRFGPSTARDTPERRTTMRLTRHFRLICTRPMWRSVWRYVSG
jgi:hypothetical protein